MTVDTLLGGRYRLLHQIGAGGMGSVWEADDLRLDRRVAVKLPTAGPTDREQLQRFAREAIAAARLSHPNVATVLDHGEDGDVPYLVLELLDGETLAERIRRGPVPPDEVVAIVGAIASALDAAHAAGVVHRDVKPANVMLTPDGVKVLDFGAATADWAPTITTTGIVGTAAYLSPEQAAGERAVAQSDVYALAVVAYEMLAGRPPFVADNPAAVIAAHLHQDPPAIREAAPGTPEHVARAVEQGLAKDPAVRPPTPSAFARSLREAAPSDAETRVLADPRTEVLSLPLAEPPARSRRWAWAAAAAVAVLLLALLTAAVGAEDPGPIPPATKAVVAMTTTTTTVTTVVTEPPPPPERRPAPGPGRENGNGNGRGPERCETRPDHPSCD